MVSTRGAKRKPDQTHAQQKSGRSKTEQNIISPSSLGSFDELPSASSLTEKEITSVASYYWDRHLKGAGWTLFSPKQDDWGFIPAQYQGTHTKDLKQNGKLGEHYAEGWVSLYEMIRKYGTFEAPPLMLSTYWGKQSFESSLPVMVSYEGPSLGNERPTEGLNHQVYTAASGSIIDVSFGDGLGDNTASLPAQGFKHHVCTVVSGSRSDVSFGAERGDETALLVNGFGIDILQGHPATACEEILPHIPETVWKQDNPMPYKYLRKVLESTQNNVFVGKIGEEICSIFSFCYSGMRDCDATVTLLWTKQNYRRKGFSTRLMHEGIQFLANDSHIMAGTSTTERSRRLFASQSWNRVDGHFAVELHALRKTLENKSRCKSTGSDSDWEASIDDDLIEIYSTREPPVSLTANRDESFDISSISDAASRSTDNSLTSPIMKSSELPLISTDVAGKRNQGSVDEDANVRKPVEHGADIKADIKEKMNLLQETLQKKNKEYKDEDDKFLKSFLKKEITRLNAMLEDLQNAHFQVRGLICLKKD